MPKQIRHQTRIRIMRSAIIVFAVLLSALAAFCVWFFNLLPQKVYTAGDFGIEVLHSPNDANGNGIDDYIDIMLGARLDAQHMPRYDGAYYEGGYPPDDIGVCTDLVWRAFQNAGYELKNLVDEDITQNPALYPGLDDGGPDPNIDFRRVRNLEVFFQRRALPLTLNLSEIDEWQPGDIVTFPGHIGIISDKRNRDGVPYLIHNSGQPIREENTLEKLSLFKKVTGHYRWDHPATPTIAQTSTTKDTITEPEMRDAFSTASVEPVPIRPESEVAGACVAGSCAFILYHKGTS